MRPCSLTLTARFPRQIYGGIGIGVAVAAALSILALSNVSRVYMNPFFAWLLVFLNGTMRPWALWVDVDGDIYSSLDLLPEVVYLDSRLQVLVAIHHRHLRGTGHHHDRRAPTRVSPL